MASSKLSQVLKVKIAERAAAASPGYGNPFPLHALPHWVANFVEAVAASIQVPTDMPAAFALGTLATAAARIADINVVADHNEPLNVFIAVIAPPGSRKSACVNAFLKPIAAIERNMVQRASAEIRAARLARERTELELAQAKTSGDWDNASRLGDLLAEQPILLEPQLTADDVTAQKLTSLLSAHRCMAIFSAEPSIFPTILGRWASGKQTPEIDVFLKGQAGDAIKVDRQGRAPESVEAPRLSMVIALQPQAMKQISSSAIVGRGLVGRMLVVASPDVRGHITTSGSVSIPDTVRETFAVRLEELFAMAPRSAPLRLTHDATARWVEFADTFERRLGRGGDMRDLHGWGEKFRGEVARIAGALHLAGSAPTSDVRRETLDAAIEIGWWLVGHVLEVFAMAQLRPEVRAANTILEFIRRDEEATLVKQRDVQQALKSNRQFKDDSETFEKGWRALIEAGFLTPVAAPPNKRGRPSRTVAVNDIVFDGFEDFEALKRKLRTVSKSRSP